MDTAHARATKKQSKKERVKSRGERARAIKLFFKSREIDVAAAVE